MLFNFVLKNRFVPATRLYSVSARSQNVTPPFIQATKYGNAIAIADRNGTHSYTQLFSRAAQLAKRIVADCKLANGKPEQPSSVLEALHGQRIAVLCNNDAHFTVASFAVWILGGCIVPLYKAHPEKMLQYYVDDSEATLLLTTHEYAEKASKIDLSRQRAKRIFVDVDHGVSTQADYGQFSQWLNEAVQKDAYNKKPAVIIYTSGTTANPKGAVLSHGNLHANITDMVSAWRFTERDVLMHLLPLNHVHGLVNALLTPLHVGACTLMLPTFEEQAVWSALLDKTSVLPQRHVSVFTAVPTIYKRLIDYHDEHLKRDALPSVREACDRVRLMVSGSAPLPISVCERWREITGHRLLERYGMTETGMLLTQPYVPHGKDNGKLIPGTVGSPFDSVQVRIIGKQLPEDLAHSHGSSFPYELLAEADRHGIRVMQGHAGESGEVLVRGAGVFGGYLNRENQTREAFASDGWFRTGDSARVELDAHGHPAAIRLLGRLSSDIIKSGAVKVSAIEIEQKLLEHPLISECAVVGLDDETWGQKVAVAVVLRNQRSGTSKSTPHLKLEELISWCKQRQLPVEHIPRAIKVLDALPKNHMGKVTKKLIVNDWSKSMPT